MEVIKTKTKSNTVTQPLSLGTQQAPVSHVRVQAKTSPSTQHIEKPVTEKDVQKAINEITSALVGANESIGFNYENKLGQLYVQVTDNVSGEVIRELPSKDFIKHKLAMQEMIGLLLDKQG